MTDAEISRRLALAIGWKADKIRLAADASYITVPAGPYDMQRLFDYRDPSVIWPIAERFYCFPVRIKQRWAAQKQDISPIVWADNAAKAVALAVIEAHEGAKE